MKTGILLINTGSPDSFNIPDVKKYLQEFLMDERIIDIPRWKRSILVYGIISPLRSKKTSKLYQNIWQENGSPLIHLTRSLSQSLQNETKIETFFAMRYGNPSIKSCLSLMEFKGIKKIILVPMFPHYAMSTYESIVEKSMEELSHYEFNEVLVVPPFYNDNNYIKALYENSKPLLKKQYDSVIFSYHSLPVRHILKSDITGSTCLQTENCCSKKSRAWQKCYRAQTYQTTKLLTSLAGLPRGKFIHSYQSAMNKKTWLGPVTEDHIAGLAKEGKKSIAVICPGFVTDNLETLEEINIRGRNIFLKNGGTDFTYIPALNNSQHWVKALSRIIHNEIKAN